MPKAKKGKGKRKQHGGNIFHTIWNGVKSVVVPAHDFIKKNKLISKGLALVPHPKAQIGSKVADQLGYGRYKHQGKGKRRPKGKVINI